MDIHISRSREYTKNKGEAHEFRVRAGMTPPIIAIYHLWEDKTEESASLVFKNFAEAIAAMDRLRKVLMEMEEDLADVQEHPHHVTLIHADRKV